MLERIKNQKSKTGVIEKNGEKLESHKEQLQKINQ